MKTKKKPTVDIFFSLKGVPPDLRQKFKSFCKDKKSNMRTELIRYMETCINVEPTPFSSKL